MKLIADIKSGTAVDAFEATKRLIDRTLSQKEVEELANIARSGTEAHNREAATHALSLVTNNSAALDVLVDLLRATENSESVRGLAAEGIGVLNLTSKSRVRKKAEDTLLACLKDSSATVRFWSSYAVGCIKSQRAIPVLQEMVTHDKEVCPGWWYVSEEAEDTIERINGRQGKERIPVQER